MFNKSGTYLILLTMFSGFAINAMEENQPSPKEIADLHYHLVIENTTKRIIKNSGIKSNFELGYNMLGDIVTKEEVDKGFFSVDWVEKQFALSRLPSEVVALYEFLKTYQFIRPLKALFVLDLINANPIPSQFKPLVPTVIEQYGVNTVGQARNFLSATENAQDCFQFFPSPSFKNSSIVKNELGLFLLTILDSDTDQLLDNKLSHFFQYDMSVKELLDASRRKSIEINLKLSTIQNLLESDKDPNQIIENILNCEHVPNTYKKILHSLRQNPNKAINRIRRDIDTALNTNEVRIRSLAKIYPCRLNILMLYSFYLLEETRDLLPFGIGETTILDCFGDEAEFSIKEYFGPIAHEVLLTLGFDPKIDKKYKEKTTTKRIKKLSKKTKPAIQKSSNKNNKKKRNKKKIAKSKRHSINYNNEEKISSLLTASPSQEEKEKEEYNNNDDQELNEIVLEATICPDEICQRKLKSTWLNSSNNPKNNHKLLLTRGHRRLDTLARLISGELLYDQSSLRKAGVGTVALALVNIKGADRLVISIKRPRPQSEIIQAVYNAIENSKKYYNDLDNPKEKIHLLKAETKRVKNLFDSSESNALLIGEFYSNRRAIDLIKFAQTILRIDTNDRISRRLAQLFNYGEKFDSDKIIFLSNSFNLHPEINIAEYLLENHLALGQFNAKNNLINYQYIGVSMLNCGMCDIILRGGYNLKGYNDDFANQNLALFSRGSYAYSYPGLIMPYRFAELNKSTFKNLSYTIYNNLPLIMGNDICSRTNMQNADISDSDEENDMGM